MSRRSRVSVSVDQVRGLLLVRLFGVVGDNETPPDLPNLVLEATCDEPWRFDVLMDFRRFAADIDGPRIGAGLQRWTDVEKRHSPPRKLALIVPDLGLRAQIMAVADANRHRTAHYFDGLDGALDWLRPAA